MQETGDVGSVPGLERSPEGGHGNPLQYSCLENPMARRSQIFGLASYQVPLQYSCLENPMARRSQRFGLASYQVPCDFNVLISWDINTVHLTKSTSANFFFSFVRLLHFLHCNYHFDDRLINSVYESYFLNIFLSSLVFLDWINYYYDGYLTVLFEFHYYFLPLSVVFYWKEYLCSHSFTSVSTHELLFNQ